MVKKIKFILVIAAPLAASACAQKASDIPATYVSTGAYAQASCDALTKEHNAVAIKLAELSGLQNAERTKDTAWMWAGGIIFLPAMAMAATGEDYSVQIGDLKGRADAIEAQMRARNCGA